MELTKADKYIRDSRFLFGNPLSKLRSRKLGFDKPFFDYAGDYKAEFNSIVARALKDFPSLVGVFEVKSMYDEGFSEFGIPETWNHLHFTDEKDGENYVQKNAAGNPAGAAYAFEDETGTLKTLVLIKQRDKSRFNVSEFRYVDKIAALLHELGHVDDHEKGLNFHRETGRSEMVAAEIHAHQYAIRRCNEAGYMLSQEALISTCRHMVGLGGYQAEIGNAVLTFAEAYPLKDWTDDLQNKKPRPWR